MKIQPVRGTHDFFGDKLLKYKKIEKVVNETARIYDFNEIVTPIFESTELFFKPLGENSDVVLKEMYTFQDRNETSLTLRPEYTTPMLRAAISNNFLEKTPQKFFGIGPMFRRERPQKGRYRQFHQINFEILGVKDIIADVELIILADSILKDLLPNKKISLYINSLGDNNTLEIFKKELSLYFNKYKNSLSTESQSKIHTNPLRILDSKNLSDNEISLNAPKISDYYSQDAKNRFSDLQNLLFSNSIEYTVNPYLVRGLDYYCHSVFEFKTTDLGSQDTLIGGGRYDALVKLLGGPDICGVGWAGGMERLIMLMENFNKNQPKVHLIVINENFKSYGLKIANKLRKNNITVYYDYKYNLKKSLSTANKLNSQYAVIIGEDEVRDNLCTIKELGKNSQKTIAIEKIVEELK